MICPSCKEEIHLSDLLITYHTPETKELGAFRGTDLAKFQADIRRQDAWAKQQAFFVLYSFLHPMKNLAIEFEHDKLDCFFHWNPSEAEILEVVDKDQAKADTTKPEPGRPVATVKRVIQIIELEKPAYGIKVLLSDENIDPPISVYRGETVDITAHIHVDAGAHENQKLGRKILRILKEQPRRTDEG